MILRSRKLIFAWVIKDPRKVWMTHDELVKIACEWLFKKKHLQIVLGDFRTVNVNEHPDAIVWKSSGWSILIEVKTSRADFLRDAKKFSRRNQYAMGQQRYYLAPENILKEEEIPEGWGFLTVSEKNKVKVVREAKHNQWHFDRMRQELPMLIAATRRDPVDLKYRYVRPMVKPKK